MYQNEGYSRSCDVLARSANDEYARELALYRGNYVVIGRGSNKTVGYREHIVYNIGGGEERRETHRGESSPRTISRRSTRVFCLVCSLLDRYHLRFFFPSLSPHSFSLSASSRSCFSSYLSLALSSSSLSVRRRGGALKCRRPDTYSFDADGSSSNVQRGRLFLIALVISIPRIIDNFDTERIWQLPHKVTCNISASMAA